jgi:hypothetical protein
MAAEYSYLATKDGQVAVSWQGRVVRRFKGSAAKRLLAEIVVDEQLALKKASGNVPRGSGR